MTQVLHMVGSEDDDAFEFDDDAAVPVADSADAEAVGAGLPGAGRPFGRFGAVAPDESELRNYVCRIVDRDQQAMALLYDAMIGKVYSVALRITRRVTLAEEAAEDTFWQIWRQAPRFDAERGTVSAWVTTIARSRALDTLRAAAPAQCEIELETTEGWGPVTDEDPLATTTATQEAGRLHAAIGRLEPLHRQLVTLAYFRGLTHEEIAQHMELPLGTVKSHIRRTLIKLREALKPGPAYDELTP